MNEPPNPEVAIFAAALELPADQRGAYLEQACAGDVPLRRQVEALLRVHDDAGDFFEKLSSVARPASAKASSDTIRLQIIPSEKPGDRIGRYKLLQQIGEGGCGVVYMAEQEEPVHRRVALKVIKLGMDTKNVIARFEAERQALALMDHPNIAKVLEAGATDTGRPYFVMELVRGIKITDYCNENSLSTVARLELFIQVCQAIQHAHQKGIIHRDIKPSNILVADHDGKPVPKIIDFGIAKATTDQRLTDKTLFTAFEQFIGTPAYMSPEQARLSGLDIDTRSDIYSLGVLLYELLMGKTPFESDRLLEAGLDEIRRIIREDEPLRPSTRLQALAVAEQTTVARHRQTDPPKLAYLIRGDLDWIVMKCLEKDRTRRYETANGLAADIQRHLGNEPVNARPPSKLYELQKLVRRNKLAFIAASGVTAALVIGLGVSTWMFVQEKEAHQQASQAEQEQGRLREAAQSAQAQETQMRQLAETRAIAYRQNAYSSDIVAANLALEDGNLGLARGLLAQHEPQPDQEDLRGFEWRYVWGRSRGEQMKTLTGHSNYVNAVAFSPDGTMLVSGSSDHTVKLWNANTGELIANCAGHSAAVISVAFSPNGKLFASGDEDGLVRIWDAQSHQISHTITTSNRWACLAFSGRLLAIATGDKYGESDGSVQLWDYASGQMGSVLPESGSRIAFSGDGNILATANWHGLIKLWHFKDLKPFNSFPVETVIALAFSPDGHFLAFGTDSGVAGLWDLTKQKPMILSKPVAKVFGVAFSPDSRLLATANQTHDITLWDVSSGQSLGNLHGHGKEVWAVAFSPDGKSLASGSLDDTIMFWNPSGSSEQNTITNIVMDPSDHVGSPVFSPDGERLAAATTGGGVLFWQTSSSRAKLDPGIAGLPIAFSPDGKSLFTRNLPFTMIRQWDVSTQSLLASTTVATPDSANIASAFSPDAKLMATYHPGKIVVNDVLTGKTLIELPVNSAARCLAFSSDSMVLASGHYDQTAKLWDLKKRQVIWTVAGFRDTVSAVAFSRQGLFAAGSWDGSIKICNINAKKELATLTGHKTGVMQLAFSSDGRTLASGGDDPAVKLWDLVPGREVLTFKTDVPQYFVQFSPDDKILATGGADGAVHFWRAPSLAAIDAAEKAGIK